MSIDVACTCSDPALKSCTACRAYEDEKRAERLRFRIERSGMPTALRRHSFLGAKPGDALDAARRWADGEMRGLCLTGPVGVGKTWLAATAAWARLQDQPLRWVSVARMMSQLRSGFGSDQKAEADAIITGTGSIVLDDLDKGAPTDFGREVIFAAVDNRIAAGSSLLVTTNMPLSSLSERYGDPIASRLSGYCTTVRIQGGDRRLD